MAPIPPVSGEPSGTSTPAKGKKRAVAQQFIKFCVVGLSSTVISMSVLYFALHVLHVEEFLRTSLGGYPNVQRFVADNKLHLQAAGTLGFVFGVTNGFFWNSRWTFPKVDSAKRHEQYVRFFAVNVSGQILNCIFTWILRIVVGLGDNPAIFGAIFIVAFWNFTLNRLWTFRNK